MQGRPVKSLPGWETGQLLHASKPSQPAAQNAAVHPRKGTLGTEAAAGHLGIPREACSRL